MAKLFLIWFSLICLICGSIVFYFFLKISLGIWCSISAESRAINAVEWQDEFALFGAYSIACFLLSIISAILSRDSK